MKMKKLLLLLFSITTINSVFAQGVMQYPKDDTTSVRKEYPYILPFWGQELTDRNIEFQLPFGVNVNYVHNSMDLELTHFAITDENGNPIGEDFINPETLNFTKTSAITNGINIRFDTWILPFFNVYGLYSETKGRTEVALAPLNMNFNTTAKFDATTWGIGTTFVYGWNDYFVNLDANYSKSKSNLLNKSLGFFVGSARIGRRVKFDNGMKLSVYMGAMYRNFVNHDINYGSIDLLELEPNLLGIIESKHTDNLNTIKDLQENRPDGWIKDVAELKVENELLEKTYTAIDKNSVIHYGIKKEIKKLWSTQVGFNWEISPNWMYRGEFGYAPGLRFFMTGLQYRFGL